MVSRQSGEHGRKGIVILAAVIYGRLEHEAHEICGTRTAMRAEHSAAQALDRRMFSRKTFRRYSWLKELESFLGYMQNVAEFPIQIRYRGLEFRNAGRQGGNEISSRENAERMTDFSINQAFPAAASNLPDPILSILKGDIDEIGMIGVGRPHRCGIVLQLTSPV